MEKVLFFLSLYTLMLRDGELKGIFSHQSIYSVAEAWDTGFWVHGAVHGSDLNCLLIYALHVCTFNWYMRCMHGFR